MSAGKGDGLRKGADMGKYRDNYDSIFRKKPRKLRKMIIQKRLTKEEVFDDIGKIHYMTPAKDGKAEHVFDAFKYEEAKNNK